MSPEHLYKKKKFPLIFQKIRVCSCTPWLQRSAAPVNNSFSQLPSSISFTDTLVSKQSCLTSQNKPTINIQPNSQPLTKNHTNNITHATSASILSPTFGNIHIATRQQDKHSMTPLTSNYQFNNNTHLDKKNKLS